MSEGFTHNNVINLCFDPMFFSKTAAYLYCIDMWYTVVDVSVDAIWTVKYWWTIKYLPNNFNTFHSHVRGLSPSSMILLAFSVSFKSTYITLQAFFLGCHLLGQAVPHFFFSCPFKYSLPLLLFYFLYTKFFIPFLFSFSSKYVLMISTEIVCTVPLFQFQYFTLLLTNLRSILEGSMLIGRMMSFYMLTWA